MGDVWSSNAPSWDGWRDARSTPILDSSFSTPADATQGLTVYDLLRRLALGLVSGTATSASMTDYESSAFIDGAELTEMDCRWSPTMGLQQGAFEETQTHAKRQGPTAGS